MKRTLVCLIALLHALAGASALSAAPVDEFSRGIAYYLIGDLEAASGSLNAYFRLRPQPAVKIGFTALLGGDKWQASRRFQDHLESNHRSLEALVGISLANDDLKNSLAISYLERLLRLSPGFAAAHLCLGRQYTRRGNFPLAQEHYERSLKLAPAVPEFKILLAEMHLQAGQPQQALDVIRSEADGARALFHYSRLAAAACLELGNGPDASRYIAQALAVQPGSLEARLLQGRLLLASGELRQARALLEKLKFPQFNPDYSLALGETLLRLKDREAERHLMEVFLQNRWQPRVNLLLGVLNMRKKGADVRHWARRAQLAGLSADELQKEFPAEYLRDGFPALPFFSARRIHWLGNRRLLVAGERSSGEREKIHVLDAGTLKTLHVFPYEGAIQEVFSTPQQDKVLFSTAAVEGEKVYLYTLLARGGGIALKPVIGYALDLPTIVAGFDGRGTTAYVTDGSIEELAFVSPFAIPGPLGRKSPVYPNFPFRAYTYSYASGAWAPIQSRSALAQAQLPALRRYRAVAQACQANAEVAKLIEKGRTLDIASSQEMRIHFAADDTRFLIVHSDLKNAFQAWAYDPQTQRLSRFDETMFLGKDSYAELDIVAFDPQQGNLLLLSRDKNRNLVHFNYRSLLYKKLASNVVAAAASADLTTVYALCERGKSLFFSEAGLEIIRLSPYNRRKLDQRRDLDAIVDCSDPAALYFTTVDGQLLKLEDEENFRSRQVSLSGALHHVSPDKRKAAAFINGRVVVLPWQG